MVAVAPAWAISARICGVRRSVESTHGVHWAHSGRGAGGETPRKTSTKASDAVVGTGPMSQRVHSRPARPPGRPQRARQADCGVGAGHALSHERGDAGADADGGVRGRGRGRGRRSSFAFGSVWARVLGRESVGASQPQGQIASAGRLSPEAAASALRGRAGRGPPSSSSLEIGGAGRPRQAVGRSDQRAAGSDEGSRRSSRSRPAGAAAYSEAVGAASTAARSAGPDADAESDDARRQSARPRGPVGGRRTTSRRGWRGPLSTKATQSNALVSSPPGWSGYREIVEAAAIRVGLGQRIAARTAEVHAVARCTIALRRHVVGAVSVEILEIGRRRRRRARRRGAGQVAARAVAAREHVLVKALRIRVVFHLAGGGPGVADAGHFRLHVVAGRPRSSGRRRRKCDRRIGQASRERRCLGSARVGAEAPRALEPLLEGTPRGGVAGQSRGGAAEAEAEASAAAAVFMLVGRFGQRSRRESGARRVWAQTGDSWASSKNFKVPCAAGRGLQTRSVVRH